MGERSNLNKVFKLGVNVRFRDLGGEVCEDMNVSAAAEKKIKVIWKKWEEEQLK